MGVDVDKAKEYLGGRNLTLGQIRVARKALSHRGMRWLIERQSGKLDKESEAKLRQWLDEQEAALRGK